MPFLKIQNGSNSSPLGKPDANQEGTGQPILNNGVACAKSTGEAMAQITLISDYLTGTMKLLGEVIVEVVGKNSKNPN